MAEQAERQSAKIYQFPVSARATARLTSHAASSRAAELPARLARVEFGSGWYHDAAIHDAEQARPY
jgi:hypothetical protein